MAVIFGQKPDPKKNNQKKSGFTSEFFHESQLAKPGLKGILGLGQTIDINHQKSEQNWSNNFHTESHLVKEQQVLIDGRQKELQKSIDELRAELQNLVKVTDNLDKEVEKSVFKEVPEANEYQVSFLQRIKNLVINFRKNISEASVWLDSFQSKSKKKKNNYWHKVKNSGEQYLMSGEHSASRSAT
ncbi:MAG: DUF5660 domain-containing protein [Candidatus Shapirobacteria bacterium]|nr:DUF5660 domain-containing protein [Candidatus Shapirobacteria bacterium]